MAKQLAGQLEMFDGFTVAIYDGSFSGAFDMEEDARDLSYDDVVTFLVTARVSGAKFGSTKLGDVKRTNIFQVTASTIVDADKATSLWDSLGQTVSGVNDTLSPMQSAVHENGDSEPQVVGSPRPITDDVLQRFLSES